MGQCNILVITGPTATGKTRLSAHVADRMRGEVISADSRQVYRRMDIGTGKDLQDFSINGRNIPYHLIDIADPGTEFNVFRFQQNFLKAYDQITGRGHLPVLCGGTGMYIEAVLKGYRLLEVPYNPALRKELESKSNEELTLQLRSLRKLHNTTDTDNRERLIRALEIALYEEEHKEEVHDFPDLHPRIFGIWFERSGLRKRITERLEKRFEEGMVNEVKSLIDEGITPRKLKFYGLEYRYITAYLEGELSYEEMFAKLNTAIHRFAKRQVTWFRRMERKGFEIDWIAGELPLAEKIDYISEKLTL